MKREMDELGFTLLLAISKEKTFDTAEVLLSTS